MSWRLRWRPRRRSACVSFTASRRARRTAPSSSSRDRNRGAKRMAPFAVGSVSVSPGIV